MQPRTALIRVVAAAFAVAHGAPIMAKPADKAREKDVPVTESAVTDCGPNAIAEAMRDLFPPAAESVRARSADLLAGCRAIGSDGVLAAAVNHTTDPVATLAMTRALASFRSPVAVTALRAIVQSDRPVAMRVLAMPTIAQVGFSDDLVTVLGDVNEDERARLAALATLKAVGRPPDKPYLEWLQRNGGPRLRKAAADTVADAMRAAGRDPTKADPGRADAAATAAIPLSAPATDHAHQGSRAPAATGMPRAGDSGATRPPSPAAAPPPPVASTGPVDGTPLVIGTSTVAGGALMLNLSLLGVQDPTPQLLLGTAGAVIGFGTSWALSRFGVRATMGQAAWFANTTAWGTLAGITIYAGSGADNYKLRYGSLVIGEVAGMAAGAWSARRWQWTLPKIVMADSLFLGAALTGIGVNRLLYETPRVTPAAAIGVVPVMVAAAVGSQVLQPTEADVALTIGTAIGGGWLGGLMGSGLARTELLHSRQGQGSLLIGAGLGYLGGAAAGAFTEVSSLRLKVGGMAMLSGNALGLGVHMMAIGLARADEGAFAAGDREAWKLGAGLGGLALGSAGFALAPRLSLGSAAAAMGLWGTAYGAGTYWTASVASYHGQPLTETTDAVLQGGVLASGVAGGIAGLMLSGRFAPDAAAQWTAFGATTATAAAGWGTAALLIDSRGIGDGVGVAAGAAVGLAGGAVFTHKARLRAPALGAAAAGAAYGAVLGSLLPTLGKPAWESSRSTAGAAMIGAGGGALAGATLGQVAYASAGEVAVPAVGGALGMGVGTGAGLMLAEDGNSQAIRVGAVAGTAAFLGGSVLADRWLRLSQGLGPSAPGLAIVGAAFGAAEGMLLAGALDSSGTITFARESTVYGGALMGASAGVAGGLALSQHLAPRADHLLLTAGSSVLLASAGYGLGELVTDGDGRGTTVAMMSGAAAGLLGGALVTPRLKLTKPVVGASLTGAAAGTVVGALITSLDAPTWKHDRDADGGLRLGMAAGLIGGGAFARFVDAKPREVGVATTGAVLGGAMGLGLGALWPRADTQPERIGGVVGLAAVGGAGMLLVRPLRLDQPLSPGTNQVVLTTVAHGIFDGVWLAGLVDPSGLPSMTNERQLQGGVLFGGALGVTTGLLLAPRVRLDAGHLLLLTGATAAGSGVGRGLALLSRAQPGRLDSTATLTGSLVGTAAGAIVVGGMDPKPVDAAAAAVGAGYGGLVGALATSFDQPTWPGWNRASTGGLLVGAGVGGAVGVAARAAVDASAEDVGLTALAGGDGALTGVGWALLLSDENPDGPAGETRDVRRGAAVGAVAGLGLGVASWSRLRLGAGDGRMIGATTMLAAWNGAWIPALNTASSNDFDRRRMGGGALAAAGTVSFGAALLAPVVEVDGDMVGDAMALDAVFTGAGAGVGALVSERADAPVAGMLAGGATGLLLGGALHRRIDLGEEDAPLLILGAAQGLWAGAWMPYLLRPPTEVTDGQRAGGVAAGAFGGFGLALLANTKFAPSSGDVAFTALGSGIGTAITGGVALMSKNISDQSAVGLMLAGTGSGLVTAGYLAPRLRLDWRAAGSASIGAALGTSEALLFAWSARASGSDQFAGAALLGAGVGTTLGLASASSIEMSRTGTPAVAGLTAWGAWMGAFAGSLFARDAHEITAGGLIGANVGLVAGYGLMRTGAVDSADFGWLSLFGAVGTVAGAAAGAPFASQGAPTPILAGLAIGPVVGMTAGALVLPRLRAARGTPAPGAVSVISAAARRFSPFSLSMRPAAGGFESAGVVPPSAGGAVASSVDVTKALQTEHAARRRLKRAFQASVQISDCAPLIGALPTPDSTASGTAPPMVVGLTGRWH